MKLINPSAKIVILDEQESLLQVVYKRIELAGRTCYKSEDKITETSAKEFVDRMISNGHTAMLEHGTVYLKDVYDASSEDSWEMSIGQKYSCNKYSKVTTDNALDIRGIYVTTNYRVLVENNWLDDLKYICDPTEFHELRIMTKFVCDRGTSHELVRHRVFSFAQESTRYCNYSKDKFGNELIYVIPSWIKEVQENISLDNFSDIWGNNHTGLLFKRSLLISEKAYFELLDTGWIPQQARQMLPNALKTEVIMTGFVCDWINFFKLRTSLSSHPDIRKLSLSLEEQFIEQNLIKP